MKNTLLLLGYSNKIKIPYNYTKYTIEKIPTVLPRFRHEIIRKFKVRHNIEVDYSTKTISINGILFQTCHVSGFVIKKMKGRLLGCSSFEGLVSHIRESANSNSVFNHSTFEILSALSNGKYQILT